MSTTLHLKQLLDEQLQHLQDDVTGALNHSIKHRKSTTSLADYYYDDTDTSSTCSSVIKADEGEEAEQQQHDNDEKEEQEEARPPSSSSALIVRQEKGIGIPPSTQQKAMSRLIRRVRNVFMDEDFHTTQRIFWWWKVMAWGRINQVRQQRRAIGRFVGAVSRGRRACHAEQYRRRAIQRIMVRRWKVFAQQQIAQERIQEEARGRHFIRLCRRAFRRLIANVQCYTKAYQIEEQNYKYLCRRSFKLWHRALGMQRLDRVRQRRSLQQHSRAWKRVIPAEKHWAKVARRKLFLQWHQAHVRKKEKMERLSQRLMLRKCLSVMRQAMARCQQRDTVAMQHMAKHRLRCSIGQWRWEVSRHLSQRLRGDMAFVYQYRSLAKRGLITLWKQATLRRAAREAQTIALKAWYYRTLARSLVHWHHHAKDLAMTSDSLIQQQWEANCRQSMTRALLLLKKHAKIEKQVRQALGRRLVRACIRRLHQWRQWTQYQITLRQAVETNRQHAHSSLLYHCLVAWHRTTHLHTKGHHLQQLLRQRSLQKCFAELKRVKKLKEKGNFLTMRRQTKLTRAYLHQWLRQARYSEHVRFLKYQHAFRLWKVMVSQKKAKTALVKQGVLLWCRRRLLGATSTLYDQRSKSLLGKARERNLQSHMKQRRLTHAFGDFCGQLGVLVNHRKQKQMVGKRWAEERVVKKVMQRLKEDFKHRCQQRRQEGLAEYHFSTCCRSRCRTIFHLWQAWARRKRRLAEVGLRVRGQRIRRTMHSYLNVWKTAYRQSRWLTESESQAIIYCEQSKLLASLTHFYRSISNRKHSRHALAVGVNGRWTWMASLFLRRTRSYLHEVVRPSQASRQKASIALTAKRRQKGLRALQALCFQARVRRQQLRMAMIFRREQAFFKWVSFHQFSRVRQDCEYLQNRRASRCWREGTQARALHLWRRSLLMSHRQQSLYRHLRHGSLRTTWSKWRQHHHTLQRLHTFQQNQHRRQLSHLFSTWKAWSLYDQLFGRTHFLSTLQRHYLKRPPFIAWRQHTKQCTLLKHRAILVRRQHALLLLRQALLIQWQQAYRLSRLETKAEYWHFASQWGLKRWLKHHSQYQHLQQLAHHLHQQINLNLIQTMLQKWHHHWMTRQLEARAQRHRLSYYLNHRWRRRHHYRLSFRQREGQAKQVIDHMQRKKVAKVLVQLDRRRVRKAQEQVCAEWYLSRFLQAWIRLRDRHRAFQAWRIRVLEWKHQHPHLAQSLATILPSTHKQFLFQSWMQHHQQEKRLQAKARKADVHYCRHLARQALRTWRFDYLARLHRQKALATRHHANFRLREMGAMRRRILVSLQAWRACALQSRAICKLRLRYGCDVWKRRIRRQRLQRLGAEKAQALISRHRMESKARYYRGWHQYMRIRRLEKKRVMERETRRAFLGHYFIAWKAYLKHIHIARQWIISRSNRSPSPSTLSLVQQQPQQQQRLLPPPSSSSSDLRQENGSINGRRGRGVCYYHIADDAHHLFDDEEEEEEGRRLWSWGKGVKMYVNGGSSSQLQPREEEEDGRRRKYMTGMKVEQQQQREQRQQQQQQKRPRLLVQFDEEDEDEDEEELLAINGGHPTASAADAFFTTAASSSSFTLDSSN